MHISLKDFSERLRQALLDRDGDKLSRYIAEDYRGISLNGTIEAKADILEAYRKDGVVLSEYQTYDEEYLEFEDLGIVTGRGYVSGNWSDIQFEHHVLFTDLYRRKDQEWEYFRSQVTEVP